MATTRTVQRATETGVAPTVINADATGDNITPVGTSTPIFIEVTNGAGAPITMTIADTTSVSPFGASAFTPSVAVTVTNGTTQLIKLSEINRFTNASDGLIHVTWSSATSVTYKLFV